jgi:hypothetical protein
LAISGLEHVLKRNVVPKSPKMARPQDVLSSYSPRLPGTETDAGTRPSPTAILVLLIATFIL